MANRTVFAPISVPQRIKDLLSQLRNDGVLSYANVIEYLLIRSGHLDPEDSKLNYPAIDQIINKK